MNLTKHFVLYVYLFLKHVALLSRFVKSRIWKEKIRDYKPGANGNNSSEPFAAQMRLLFFNISKVAYLLHNFSIPKLITFFLCINDVKFLFKSMYDSNSIRNLFNWTSFISFPLIENCFMSQKVGKAASKVFSKTINSPKTSFPMFANPALREKPYLKKCTSGMHKPSLKYYHVDLYNWQKQARSGPQYKRWITHDGPPYANGDLHMGHFENKVFRVFRFLCA